MIRKLLMLCLPLAATVAMAQKTDEAAKYAAVITPEGMREKLTILASADMEGRETASPGQKKAAAYIESLFKSFGLKPGNGDSYQQLYPVYQDWITEKKLSVNGKNYEWDKDFNFALQNVNTGVWSASNIIFAGLGSAADFAKVDVKGKIVLILDTTTIQAGFTMGRPPAGGPATSSPTTLARNAGAVGILIASRNFPRRPTSLKGRMSLKPAAAPATPTPAFPIFTVSEEVASALLGRTSKVSMNQLLESPKGRFIAEVSLAATKSPVTLESSNVVGVLPGTDKKDEYLFLTGHYDHLGKVGDVIYYGADDDGSGTTGVLQMAEAFSAAAKKGQKPRRTIVFMTVSGEEKGLLGSEYYSEHPLFPLEKTTADLNTDMIGRLDTSRKTGEKTNFIYVIGHDKLSSDLPVINEAVNNQYTHLALDYKFDDPSDKERIYFRSDHYNFAKKGVPILFFYDGMLGEDYHKPTDTVEKINFEVMAKRAQLVFHTAWVMANRDDMLKRDKPLNMPSR